MSARILFVIRHADAGDPKAWTADDALRPLSDKGVRQAAAIAVNPALDASSVLLSSPSLRCVQTIEPLGERLRLSVELEDWLVTGEDPLVALDELLGLTTEVPDGSALSACTHGDLVEGFVERFSQLGVEFVREPNTAKGALLTVTVDGGKPARVDFSAPPKIKKGVRA